MRNTGLRKAKKLARKNRMKQIWQYKQFRNILHLADSIQTMNLWPSCVQETKLFLNGMVLNWILTQLSIIWKMVVL